jgi:hypothetical protein
LRGDFGEEIQASTSLWCLRRARGRSPTAQHIAPKHTGTLGGSDNTMTTIHNISKFAAGGLTGTQSAQRDWSPYVVHFTSWSAMVPIRAAVNNNLTPDAVTAALDTADTASFAVTQLILNSGHIRQSTPKPQQSLRSCVCLSECNLPGLINHAERFGRFGFVFRKSDVFQMDGRPCLYMDREMYGEIDKLYSTSAIPWQQRLWGLVNVYSPPGNGQIQDFTHEREWRVFSDVGLDKMVALICPDSYRDRILPLIAGKYSVPIIPIDVLHEWGA